MVYGVKVAFLVTAVRYVAGSASAKVFACRE